MLYLTMIIKSQDICPAKYCLRFFQELLNTILNPIRKRNYYVVWLIYNTYHLKQHNTYFTEDSKDMGIERINV